MWNYFKKYSALIEYHITMLYKPCVRRHNFLYRTVNCWACWWRWYPSPITTSSTPMSHTPWCPPPSYSSWQRRSSGSSPPETCLVGRQGCYGRSEDCKGEAISKRGTIKSYLEIKQLLNKFMLLFFRFWSLDSKHISRKDYRHLWMECMLLI